MTYIICLRVEHKFPFLWSNEQEKLMTRERKRKKEREKAQGRWWRKIWNVFRICDFAVECACALFRLVFDHPSVQEGGKRRETKKQPIGKILFNIIYLLVHSLMERKDYFEVASWNTCLLTSFIWHASFVAARLAFFTRIKHD